MKNTATEHILRHHDGSEFCIVPRIVCRDGFSMSVQAHSGSYCSPRDGGKGPWDSVELGFPSAREELLMPYVEDSENPTDTVYGYVPIEVVEQVIEKHGGIKL